MATPLPDSDAWEVVRKFTARQHEYIMNSFYADPRMTRRDLLKRVLREYDVLGLVALAYADVTISLSQRTDASFNMDVAVTQRLKYYIDIYVD